MNAPEGEAAMLSMGSATDDRTAAASYNVNACNYRVVTYVECNTAPTLVQTNEAMAGLVEHARKYGAATLDAPSTGSEDKQAPVHNAYLISAYGNVMAVCRKNFEQP